MPRTKDITRHKVRSYSKGANQLRLVEHIVQYEGLLNPAFVILRE